VSSCAAGRQHRLALRDRTALSPCADVTSLPRWDHQLCHTGSSASC